MMAYNAFRQIEAYSPAQLIQLQQALLREPMAPSFAKRNPTYENVCMGYKKQCTCGQPFDY
jgi:RNA exonuclease 4